MWTPEEETELKTLYEAGADYDSIFIHFPNKTKDSIRSKCYRLTETENKEEVPIEVPPDVLQLYQESASSEEDDVSQLWDYYQKKNSKEIEKARTRQKFSINFPSMQPIGLSFISDQHISGGTACDLQRMKADAEYIRSTPGLYCCLVGDGIDNHIKHRAAMVTNSSSPDEQYQLYNYYLKILQEKILVAISGNHDLWTMDVSGVDMVKELAHRNKIQYAVDEAHISITVGDTLYKLAFRHQYKMGSSYNQTHAVKQWLRLGDETFDIGAVGHHHEAALESFFYRGKETWVCRPGSYQITSPYASKYGFQLSVPTCPTFILFPSRREIVGFSNLYHAGNFLNFLNN